MFQNIPVLDGHVHYAHQVPAEMLISFLDETGTDSACIPVVSHSRCLSLTPAALAMKHMAPGRFYIFTGPDAAEYYLHPDTLGTALAGFTERALRMGCDGVKMLEGKPQMRKKYPFPPFDSPVWDPFFAFCEEHAVPILWHVNDPSNFWDENAPVFAKQQGWVYDESYINNEVQYAEVLNVLAHHPALRLDFAHFFFLSDDLPRLDAILDRYPNIAVDLTPGIEMYESFSAAPADAAAFFRKHGNRIIYGTDICGRCVLMGEEKPFNRKENLRRPALVRQFLAGSGEVPVESDGDYLIGRAPFTMHCLGLGEAALRRILGDNFRALAGSAPRGIEPELILEECARQRAELKALDGLVPGFVPDDASVSRAERYFGALV